MLTRISNPILINSTLKYCKPISLFSIKNKNFTTKLDKNTSQKTPLVNFKIVDLNNKFYDVKAYEGEMLMTAGARCGVPFEQSCGGNGECTTCHCYLPISIRQHLDYIEEKESEMDTLDFVAGSTEDSRLACQCKIVKNAFEGETIEFVYSLQ